VIDQALEARATVSRLAFQLQQQQRQRSDKKKNPSRDQRDHLGEELGRAREALIQTLELLPNWIDWEVVVEDQEEDNTGDGVEDEAEEPSAAADTTSLGEVPNIPEDPLFCLGGYEELLSSSGSSDGGVVVLTGPGCQLALALTRFVRDSIHKAAAPHVSSGKNNITWYNLPASLPRLVQQQQQQQDIPSWKVLLERQHGSLLWDRQLPLVHLLQCSSSSCCVGTFTGSSSLLERGEDLRETERRQSWQQQEPRKNKKKAQVPRCWHQRLQPQSPQIQILALTGPSLAADSRPFQRSLSESLRAMYQQLLADDNDDDDSNTATVRVRAVPPHELTTMESSRLVVEGLWRQRSSKGSKRRPRPAVCLAYVSNLQDYYCTANNSKIRHGTTKEGLHVLQGTLYSTAETLEWLCQNRATPHGVSMPRVLRQQDHHLFGIEKDWLAYRRKVTVKKKGGKKIVEDILVPAAAPAPHVSKSTNSRKTNNVNGSSHRPEPGKSDSPSLPQPTPERIRAEALSTPFHFLPFYYR